MVFCLSKRYRKSSNDGFGNLLTSASKMNDETSGDNRKSLSKK